jgi:penicillin G amidase
MRKLRVALAAALVAVLLAVGWAAWVARRALPPREGTFRLTGVHGQVEILRDRWGVPHVFAASDDDAYFALGWATAQDRLFQMELNRRLAQGRLAEVFGSRAAPADRLFRTMDFAGTARRMMARARPEASRTAEAYARGINAWVRELNGRLPPEFALLRIGFEPARADDFAGILGFMAWNLNLSWEFDPLFERLVDKVGEERALELYPYDFGGSPSVYPAPGAHGLRLSLLERPEDERDLLSFGPSLSGSNNWVVGPRRSATGKAILCNDPHLAHALPGIWYEAHVKTPTLDVAGVTVPGFPLVVIGHNRDIAWGMTNLMVDGADFFVEKMDPDDPSRVMSKGEWVPILSRAERIKVRGAPDVTFTVRTTPHGPVVSDLMPGETRALAYQWNYHVVSGGGEIDAFYALDRARNWEEFRAAARHFGAVAQNVVYADRSGHIGLQAVGAIPRFHGRRDGLRFRRGWDGSEDWDGFVPFEDHPVSFDPPRGWLASANNPTVPAPAPYYISSQWEPVDRYARIAELLESRPRLSVEDMERMQSDTVVVSARELVPLILSACDARPASDPTARAAVDALRGWDGDMKADSPAAALFAVFYRRLFYEIFDELGDDLARAYRTKANISAIMMHAVLSGGHAHDHWFDRAETPAVEGRDDVLRAALEGAAAELRGRLGGEPRTWRWDRLHTLELQHPLGRASRLLGFYFNRGPYPVPGHNQSVNKMEYDDTSFRVLHGPSMRQITDFSSLERTLAVLPGGESGIPSSPHYADLTPLWLKGQYHPLLMERGAIEAVAEGRQVLEP